jgi:hypothetical protein
MKTSNSNNEIEEGVRQMNNLHPSLFVPLPVVQFIDRTIEVERMSTRAEFRRCDAALDAHSRMDDCRHGAEDDKIHKAHETLNHRLEEMNQFRAQILDERATFLRREMYDREHASLAERVKTLEIVRGEQSGKTAAYASVVAFVVIAAQIVLHLWK